MPRKITAFLRHRNKALVAAAGAAGVTIAALADGHIDQAELTAIVAAWSGVFGVHQITNGPKP